MKDKHQILPQLTIEKMAAEGKSIAYHGQKVVFVSYAAPGDVADLSVKKNRSGFMEADIETLHQPSSLRVSPACMHFGLCGGCKWQHVEYAAQASAKEQQVKDQITRIGKLEPQRWLPILQPPSVYGYRNKLEFTFTDARWLSREEIDSGEPTDRRGLGFYLPGRYDRILDIQHCHLQAEPSNRIRLSFKEFAIKHQIGFYNRNTHTGLLRNVIIRSTVTGQWMVILVVLEEDKNSISALLDYLISQVPELTSVYYVVNSKKNDTITDLSPVLYFGEPFIVEQMENLQFRLGPQSFYQTNSLQALELYKVVRSMAGLSGNEVVYDLYTGTGTIALFVAAEASRVVGVEYVEAAVADARVNAQRNGIQHVSFFAGDMKAVLNPEFVRQNGQPDVVITDPPRAGMHEDVVKTLLEMSPNRIVYVSCNPATQARDLEILASRYQLLECQPVDMFPQTAHVENVALLQRND